MKPAFAATLLVALAGALGACVSVPEDPNQLQRSKPNLEEASRLNTDLGVDYARKGNFDMALVKLQRALDQNSGYAPAHIAIAFVYSQLGKTDDADTHYRKALSLTDDGSVRNNYGVFLCEQKRYDDAEKMFLAAVADRRYQAPEAAWTNAGQCERRVPNLDKAETYFREALKVRPQFADALSQMAWICYQKGDYLRARAFLQRYEKVGPPTPETLLIGAQTETALGDAAAAAAYNTRLREQFPESDERPLFELTLFMNADSAASPPPAAYGSPGEAIRNARERAHLTLDELAARTRLARPVLEALERDAFDQLLEPVYVRGYYRKVASVLGLPEEPLIKAYRERYTPPPRTAPARLRLASGGELGESSRIPRSLAVLAPIAAIIICAVVWVLRESRNGGPPGSQITMIDPTSGTDVPITPPPSAGGSIAEPAPADTSGTAAAVTTAPAEAGAPATADPSIAATAPTGATTVPAGTPAPGTTATAPAGTTGVAPAGTPATTVAAVNPAASATGTQLVLNFNAISWARVEDRSGKSLLSGVIGAGEVKTLDGQPPYSVFLGNAPGVSVQFRGQAMNIKPFTKDNSTARFTVPAAGG